MTQRSAKPSTASHIWAFFQKIEDEVVNCPIWLFHLWHLTKHFSIIWLSPGVMEHFSPDTIGTMCAASYNNTLRDGLVLWQNTNNFQDMLHPSSPSIISLHFTSTGALMAEILYVVKASFPPGFKQYPLCMHLSAFLTLLFHTRSQSLHCGSRH